jgi:hypothetical protein
LALTVVVHRAKQLTDVFLLPLFQQKWLVCQITFDVRANTFNEIDDSI